MLKKFEEAKARLQTVIIEKSLVAKCMPRFRKMEWRIELEMHRKNLRNVYTPVVLMRFWSHDENNGCKDRAVLLRLSDLLHMRDVLEEALSESKSLRIERRVRKWL